MPIENQNWIEVVDGSLNGCITLPSGVMEIIGVTWRENDDSAFRLFEKDNPSRGEVGACWIWAGDARRSILVLTPEGRHYGRLKAVAQTASAARFSIEIFEEAE